MPYVSSITVAGNVGDISKFTSPLKLFDYLSAGRIILCSDFNVLKEIIMIKKMHFLLKIIKIYMLGKNEIYKLKNQIQKQLIMSKNNVQLSKQYTLKKRAKKILNSIK